MKTKLASIILFFIISCPAFSLNTTEIKTLNFQGMERSYRIHFPSGYNSNKAYPLVLAFHGGGGNPRQFENSSGFDAMADKYGYILVYPAGTGALKTKLLTWNPDMHIQTYSSRNNIDDAGFVKELVLKLEQNYKIDKNRIYLLGHSNGAMMVQDAASKYPQMFAAVVSIAGTIGGQADSDSPEEIISAPKTPIPFMEIHGMKDTNVNYYGGQTYGGFGSQKERIDISVARTIKFWVDANKCNSSPVVTDTSAYTKEDYNQCGENSEVVLYTVKDGTHFLQNLTEEIDLKEVIWAFFNQHKRL